VKNYVILGLLVCLVMCTETEQKDAVDLVPGDNEISGWTRTGSVDIAENETQLLALINGEGQVFIDNGFVKFVRQRYQGTVSGNQRELELRIIDMNDAENAETVYDETGFGSETPWTEDGHAGTEAREGRRRAQHVRNLGPPALAALPSRRLDGPGREARAQLGGGD